MLAPFLSTPRLVIRSRWAKLSETAGCGSGSASLRTRADLDGSWDGSASRDARRPRGRTCSSVTSRCEARSHRRGFSPQVASARRSRLFLLLLGLVLSLATCEHAREHGSTGGHQALSRRERRTPVGAGFSSSPRTGTARGWLGSKEPARRRALRVPPRVPPMARDEQEWS